MGNNESSPSNLNISKASEAVSDEKFSTVDENYVKNLADGKILCLDGGGMRGMNEAVMIEYLMQFLKKEKEEISSVFEYIVGTSTGGIVALYLGLGHTPSECIQLYETFKNSVFGSATHKAVIECLESGDVSNNYELALKNNTTNLEEVLKQTFGEETRMSAIENVKVIITVTLGKQDPMKLMHYTNFESTTKDGLIWKVARATSAAPGYFEKFYINEEGPFYDGGLTANNPTFTALDKILNLNEQLDEFDTKVNTLLSLGSGVRPIVDEELPDVPHGFIDFMKEFAKGEILRLITMLMHELTRTDGYIIDQAKTFCKLGGIKYLRLSPPLSEMIKLDETDDKKLNKMIEETVSYVKENQTALENLFK